MAHRDSRGGRGYILGRRERFPMLVHGLAARRSSLKSSCAQRRELAPGAQGVKTAAGRPSRRGGPGCGWAGATSCSFWQYETVILAVKCWNFCSQSLSSIAGFNWAWGASTSVRRVGLMGKPIRDHVRSGVQLGATRVPRVGEPGRATLPVASQKGLSSWNRSRKISGTISGGFGRGK